VTEIPYTRYSSYLKRRYGARTHRVCVDAGFSCPHRSGRSSAGCTYCGEEGSRAPYLDACASPDDAGHIGPSAAGLPLQVERAIRFLENRYGKGELILYFQAFSCTNAPPGVLEKIYDAALGMASFRELVVSTRPDCIDEAKADLLRSYMSPTLDVWVELGLQSANDATLRRLSRGHSAADFASAYNMVRQRNIKVAAHIILGLPGETSADMANTARFLADLRPDGLKIHNLHIPSRTPIAREFEKGEVCAPVMERHIENVISVLELLPPETLIMRLTCDTPHIRLLSPRFTWGTQVFCSRLSGAMRARETWQGRLYIPRS
jgi:radical SAM protein (TIGR01212 family)